MTADQGRHFTKATYLRSGSRINHWQRPWIDVHRWTPTGVGNMLLWPSAPATTAPARGPSERSAAPAPRHPPPPIRPRSGCSNGGTTPLARAGGRVGNRAVDVGAVANTVAGAAPAAAEASASVALTPLATAGAADATTTAVGVSPSLAASAAALKCSAALVAAGATLVTADVKQLPPTAPPSPSAAPSPRSAHRRRRWFSGASSPLRPPVLWSTHAASRR